MMSSLWRKANKAKIAAYAKKYYIQTRINVLSHYSNGTLTCACCSENRYEFLSIDHINGGGNQHRKRLGSKYIYSWLVQSNFPYGYQVLCHNCNMAKAFYKICPHQLEREDNSNAKTTVPKTSSSEAVEAVHTDVPQVSPSDQ